ncbi:bifunctional hydroxymethylpyrimidine kinase/phosphomethylpyrimidine kinase [Anaerosporobacter faecicola]|uniref:bifunctional hydroxymethylpyrimidine kinase/phosphomethylpyrimidine kinase n=1 Tax=Anaerosporobacter faecicola TaxID=2718714 RepID=UPI001439DC1E|nr:bifunctional hydroxymethylpyrimidine kinase/phosphomethylpyrimidine kinase [Anaerosporobacter faecicola]
MVKALTIAGSDCSGGAGIQADLKTMTVHGVYGMSVITALTAQNTMGVTGIMEVPIPFLEKQLDAVFADIVPDAVKVGMVSSSAIIRTIADRLTYYHAKNVVIDPVMVATSGSALVQEEAICVMKERFFHIADLITPNIPEIEKLTGIGIHTTVDMENAAKQLHEQYGVAVLCKGGHFEEEADDLLYMTDGAHWLRGKRIANPNTHGTGCTLSSAIASNLAMGMSVLQAVELGKGYIAGAIEANLDLGKGRGPLNHMWKISE